LSPALDVLYGNAYPTRVSRVAVKRESVEGTAEPMNGDARMFGVDNESQVCPGRASVSYGVKSRVWWRAERRVRLERFPDLEFGGLGRLNPGM
jgi:hypothetical protein